MPVCIRLQHLNWGLCVRHAEKPLARPDRGQLPVRQVAASVMALARLLYEFGGALSGLVPELLPAVLSLLRSKAREVIKAVLGLIKVRATP